MKRSKVINKLIAGVIGLIVLNSSALADVCPDVETMKTGVVLINNSKSARLFVRLDKDLKITELYLNDHFSVKRNQFHVHERGLFLSYERNNGITRSYIPHKPFDELFPLETGKVWHASVNVFEDQVLVRKDVPYKFSVGGPAAITVGECNFNTVEVTRETVSVSGDQMVTKYFYEPRLNLILAAEGEHLWSSEDGGMAFDELRMVRNNGR